MIAIPNTFFYANLGLARKIAYSDAQSAAARPAAHREIYPDSQACCLEVNGALASFITAASPLTNVLNLGMSGVVEEGDLYEIEQFYLQRAAQVFIELCPLADGETMALLSKRGYQPVQYENVLARPIPVDAFQFAPAFPVVDPERELWARMLGQGFTEMDDPSDEALDTGRILHQTEGLCAYGVELDGCLSSAAALEIRGDIATFSADATLPKARGRGAQTALIQHRLLDAQKKDCQIAVAMTAPGSVSQQNYERHGFRVMWTKTTFTKIG